MTGVLGILLVLNGSIIGGAAMVKEKEAGTIEQLLMTPAQAVEIVTAKIARCSCCSRHRSCWRS